MPDSTGSGDRFARGERALRRRSVAVTRQVEGVVGKGSGVQVGGCELRSAYAKWICHLEQWTHYCTFTFRSERNRNLHVEGAYILRNLWATADVGCTTWLASEFGRVGGRYHIHGLIASDDHGLWNLEQQWRNTRGWCNLKSVASGPDGRPLGAARYISKYITKDHAEYDIFGEPKAWEETGRRDSRQEWKQAYKAARRQEAEGTEEEKTQARKALAGDRLELARIGNGSCWVDVRPVTGYDLYLQDRGRK